MKDSRYLRKEYKIRTTGRENRSLETTLPRAGGDSADCGDDVSDIVKRTLLKEQASLSYSPIERKKALGFKDYFGGSPC